MANANEEAKWMESKPAPPQKPSTEQEKIRAMEHSLPLNIVHEQERSQESLRLALAVFDASQDQDSEMTRLANSISRRHFME